jgi:hypothetical protein
MLEDLTPEIRIPKCKVRTILATLEPKDQEILKAALVDPVWTPYSLSKALATKGVHIGDKPIAKHIAGGCSC